MIIPRGHRCGVLSFFLFCFVGNFVFGHRVNIHRCVEAASCLANLGSLLPKNDAVRVYGISRRFSDEQKGERPSYDRSENITIDCIAASNLCKVALQEKTVKSVQSTKQGETLAKLLEPCLLDSVPMATLCASSRQLGYWPLDIFTKIYKDNLYNPCGLSCNKDGFKYFHEKEEKLSYEQTEKRTDVLLEEKPSLTRKELVVPAWVPDYTLSLDDEYSGEEGHKMICPLHSYFIDEDFRCGEIFGTRNVYNNKPVTSAKKSNEFAPNPNYRGSFNAPGRTACKNKYIPGTGSFLVGLKFLLRDSGGKSYILGTSFLCSGDEVWSEFSGPKTEVRKIETLQCPHLTAMCGYQELLDEVNSEYHPINVILQCCHIPWDAYYSGTVIKNTLENTDLLDEIEGPNKKNLSFPLAQLYTCDSGEFISQIGIRQTKNAIPEKRIKGLEFGCLGLFKNTIKPLINITNKNGAYTAPGAHCENGYAYGIEFENGNYKLYCSQDQEPKLLSTKLKSKQFYSKCPPKHGLCGIEANVVESAETREVQEGYHYKFFCCPIPIRIMEQICPKGVEYDVVINEKRTNSGACSGSSSSSYGCILNEGYGHSINKNLPTVNDAHFMAHYGDEYDKSVFNSMLSYAKKKFGSGHWTLLNYSNKTTQDRLYHFMNLDIFSERRIMHSPYDMIRRGSRAATTIVDTVGKFCPLILSYCFIIKGPGKMQEVVNIMTNPEKEEIEYLTKIMIFVLSEIQIELEQLQRRIKVFGEQISLMGPEVQLTVDNGVIKMKDPNNDQFFIVQDLRRKTNVLDGRINVISSVLRSYSNFTGDIKGLQFIVLDGKVNFPNDKVTTYEGKLNIVGEKVDVIGIDAREIQNIVQQIQRYNRGANAMTDVINSLVKRNENRINKLLFQMQAKDKYTKDYDIKWYFDRSTKAFFYDYVIRCGGYQLTASTLWTLRPSALCGENHMPEYLQWMPDGFFTETSGKDQLIQAYSTLYGVENYYFDELSNHIPWQVYIEGIREGFNRRGNYTKCIYSNAPDDLFERPNEYRPFRMEFTLKAGYVAQLYQVIATCKDWRIYTNIIYLVTAPKEVDTRNFPTKDPPRVKVYPFGRAAVNGECFV